MYKKAIIVILACMLLLSGCKGNDVTSTPDSSQDSLVSSDLQTGDDTSSDDTSSDEDDEFIDIGSDDESEDDEFIDFDSDEKSEDNSFEEDTDSEEDEDFIDIGFEDEESEDNSSDDNASLNNDSSKDNTSSKNDESSKNNSSKDNASSKNEESSKNNSSKDDVASKNNSSKDDTSSKDEDKGSEDDEFIDLEDPDDGTLGDDIFDMDFDLSDDDLDFSGSEEDEFVLKGPDFRPTGNTAALMSNLKGGADAEAEKLRNEILNSATDIKPKDSRFTFYISEKNGDDDNDGTTPETAWKTTDALQLNMYKVGNGSTVLFERGGLYRVNTAVQLKSGVSYGAYGKGEKPMLTSSTKNYANELLWKPSHKKYVWMCDIKHYIDIGNIVFEHGKQTGTKQSKLANLSKNFDFYSDEANGVCYLYLNTGNPGVMFKSIDLCPRVMVMSAIGKVEDIVIDNLCMKYSGAFGVSVNGTAKNMKITNCEIGFMGGSYMPHSAGSRYGNGIEFYGNAIDCLVQNNWVYQVYDAGITHQGDEAEMKNITFDKNLIEYCTWSIEVWNTDEDGNDSEDDNIEIYEDLFYTNNIMRFAGLGWAQQRHVNEYDSHINCWNNLQKTLKNMQISGNIFDTAAVNLIHWRYDEKNWGSAEEQQGVTISGNTYYQSYEGIAHWGKHDLTASDQATLEDAIKVFDSNPTKIGWIGK